MPSVSIVRVPSGSSLRVDVEGASDGGESFQRPRSACCMIDIGGRRLELRFLEGKLGLEMWCTTSMGSAVVSSEAQVPSRKKRR